MATPQTSLQLGGRESDAILGNQVPRVTFFTKNTSHPKRSLRLGPWTRPVTAEGTGVTVDEELTHFVS